MKKSKIIVPALGILLLSTAASVSGTVAWFTANRTYNASAGNFSVVSTGDNLNCTMAGGLGTQVNASDDTVIELANNAYKLTDASFDHLTEKFIIPDASGTKVDRSIALGSAVLGASNTSNNLFRTDNVYSAFTWEMDFSVAFSSSSTKNVGLYLDLANSSFDGGGSPTTAKGFRMAFIPNGSANAVKRVWADLETAAKSTYIAGDTAAETPFAGTGAVTPSAYVSPALIDSADATALPADGSATETTTNYLGKFICAAGTTVHLQYKVVVWYEGSDENITNTSASTVYDTVSTSLAFAIRNFA